MYYNRRTKQQECDIFDKLVIYTLIAIAFPVNIIILGGLFFGDKETKADCLALIKPILGFLLIWFIFVALYCIFFK